MRRPLPHVVACLIIVFTAIAFAQSVDRTKGTWSAYPRKNGDLQFELRSGERNNQFGNGFAISEFTGLTQAQVSSPNAPVEFQLKRDAGTVNFKGVFTNGKGTGDYSFTADPAFIKELQAQNITADTDQLFTMAMVDASRKRLADLRAVGYDLTAKQFIEASIFDVTGEKVRAFEKLSGGRPTLREMVELQIHEVTPQYVQAMRADLGTDLPLRKIMEMSIHGVKPGMKQQYEKLGVTNLDAQDLIAFRIHEVTPEYIAEMKKAGLGNLSAHQLQEMRIFNVNSAMINDFAKVGLKNLSARDLVQLRIHSISPEFVQEARNLDSNASVSDIVEMKITGRMFRRVRRGEL